MNFSDVLNRTVWLLYIVLVASISIWLSLTLYGMLPASVGSIKDVVDLSSENNDARLLVIGALKENPNPTVGQISDLNVQVKEIIVRDLTGVSVRDVYGDRFLPFRIGWLKFGFSIFVFYFLAVAVSVISYLFGKLKSNVRYKGFFG